MNKIKVAVHGSYYADNFGDTLLVSLMCERAAAIVGRDNVFLATKGNSKEQRDIGFPVIKPDQRKTITHLIYAGGGYFGERSGSYADNISWSIRNYMRHILWLQKFDVENIAILGVGVGPISNTLLRNAVRRLFNRSKLVLVRDTESFDYLKKYEFNIDRADTCVDFALSIPIQEKTRSDIALHIDGLNIEEMKHIFNEIYKKYGATSSIHVIFDNSAGDTPQVRNNYIAAAHSAGITITDFIVYENFSTLLELLSCYSLVFTSKLHVGIVTIAQGGKVISIPVHQKTIRLYRQLGLASYCISTNDLKGPALESALHRIDDFIPNRSIIAYGISKIASALNDFLGD